MGQVRVEWDKSEWSRASQVGVAGQVRLRSLHGSQIFFKNNMCENVSRSITLNKCGPI